MPVAVVRKLALPVAAGPRALVRGAKVPQPPPVPAVGDVALVGLAVPRALQPVVPGPDAAGLLAGVRRAGLLGAPDPLRVAPALEAAEVRAAVPRGDALGVEVGEAPAVRGRAHAVPVAVPGGVVRVAGCAGAAGEAGGRGACVGGAEGGGGGFGVGAVYVVAAMVSAVLVVDAVGVVTLVCAAWGQAVVWVVLVGVDSVGVGQSEARDK